MPKVAYKFNAENPVALQQPSELDQAHRVPSALVQGKTVRMPPGKEGLFMWKQAAKGVAFVGVINMHSCQLHIRPLVPRSILDPDKKGAEKLESVAYESTWSISQGGKKLMPIKHNQGGTSHDQLRNYAIGNPEVADDTVKQGFAGFALTKRDGTDQDPHLLSLRSGTLNKKFDIHGGNNKKSGWTVPKDWAELIKSTLETYLPE